MFNIVSVSLYNKARYPTLGKLFIISLARMKERFPPQNACDASVMGCYKAWHKTRGSWTIAIRAVQKYKTLR